MKLNKLIELLDSNKESSLHIMLSNGSFVPSNFHITEVGRVQKTFIDCGGVRRESVTCQLQVWTANDIDHRLNAEKLLKILRLGEEILGSNDLEIEIEYGKDVAALYALKDVRSSISGLTFVLSGKMTDCLAPDKCGITCQKEGCC